MGKFSDSHQLFHPSIFSQIDSENIFFSSEKLCNLKSLCKMAVLRHPALTEEICVHLPQEMRQEQR